MSKALTEAAKGGDTDAAKWLLPRVAPERWAQTVRLDVKGGIRVRNEDPIVTAALRNPEARKALETLIDALPAPEREDSDGGEAA